MFCLVGSLGFLLPAPSETPWSAGPALTLVCVWAGAKRAPAKGSLDVNSISGLQDPVLSALSLSTPGSSQGPAEGLVPGQQYRASPLPLNPRKQAPVHSSSQSWEQW